MTITFLCDIRAILGVLIIAEVFRRYLMSATRKIIAISIEPQQLSAEYYPPNYNFIVKRYYTDYTYDIYVTNLRSEIVKLIKDSNSLIHPRSLEAINKIFAQRDGYYGGQTRVHFGFNSSGNVKPNSQQSARSRFRPS